MSSGPSGVSSQSSMSSSLVGGGTGSESANGFSAGISCVLSCSSVLPSANATQDASLRPLRHRQEHSALPQVERDVVKCACLYSQL